MRVVSYRVIVTRCAGKLNVRIRTRLFQSCNVSLAVACMIRGDVFDEREFNLKTAALHTVQTNFNCTESFLLLT